MNKSITIFGAAILFSSFVFTSCSNSIESDAEKAAEMQCKSIKLLEKVGKVSLVESTSLLAEMELFDKEMKTKYSSEEQKKKFEDACLKATAAGCK